MAEVESFGPLYASCVLRAFAEQLADSLGKVSGRGIYVVPGDGGALAPVLQHRGAAVVDAEVRRPEGAAALASLGIAGGAADTFRELQQRVSTGGTVAAINFTETAAHEAIALRALAGVGADMPTPWLTRLTTDALPQVSITSITDVVRFDSPRQFYAALIGERASDAGLDAIEQRRILAEITKQLAPHTSYDDTVRLPVEAQLLVWR